MNPEDLRTVGVIVGAHGLQGTFKLEPLSDFPERFEALRTVYLLRGETVLAQCTVKNLRWANALLLLTLREIRTRDEADQLRGVEVCVPDTETWTLPEDVYYTTDIIGYMGVAEDGTVLGTLKDIQAGAQDILQFEKDGDELLVPFVKEWVGTVNTEKRTIEILNWRQLASSEVIEPSPETDDD
ncbi:MAG TPA: ribosome maturation factor RimM [bacterium]|jgi:16S rRNA processing protein RimM